MAKNKEYTTAQIAAQWKTFSKTAAFKQFIDYIDFQDQMAIMAAKGPVMTFNEESGQEIAFNRELAASLLQRSVGYDIVQTYVEGYVEYTTPNKE